MLIKLVEVSISTPQSSVRELYINPQSIVSISADYRTSVLEETKSLGFSSHTCFSTIIINEGSNSRTITVAHSPDEINKKINSSKTLLKG